MFPQLGIHFIFNFYHMAPINLPPQRTIYTSDEYCVNGFSCPSRRLALITLPAVGATLVALARMPEPKVQKAERKDVVKPTRP